MEPMKLPRYLDAPQTFLLWRADQALLMGVFFVVGIFSDHLFTCLLPGLVVAHVFGRFSNGKPEGYLLHLLYWWGVAPIRGRAVLNPFHRQVLPP